jgi:ubiquinone/menaquinone biosynthesis C-methylase UbiE
MNSEHLAFCASNEWRDVLRNWIIPFAVADAQLGDDVLEIGAGPGLTTDLLRADVARVTAVELDPGLAEQLATRLGGTNVDVVNTDATTMPFEDARFTGAVAFTMLHHVPTADLQDRLFGEVARVLRPGAVFVAADSLASDELAAFHHDDVYNPLDPATLVGRLEAAGFSTVDVRTNEYGWAAHATH